MTRIGLLVAILAMTASLVACVQDDAPMAPVYFSELTLADAPCYTAKTHAGPYYKVLAKVGETVFEPHEQTTYEAGTVIALYRYLDRRCRELAMTSVMTRLDPQTLTDESQSPWSWQLVFHDGTLVENVDESGCITCHVHCDERDGVCSTPPPSQ